jgi:hypothetical protein
MLWFFKCIRQKADVGKFYGHLVYFVAILVYFMAFWCVYFMVIWYIFPVLVRCAKKNLATLLLS